jgi:hypothetical protein
MKNYDDYIADYWAEHYLAYVKVPGWDKEFPGCSLCGQSGVIDTTGIKTPAGYSVGRKNYCICPNGQVMRKGGASIKD